MSGLATWAKSRFGDGMPIILSEVTGTDGSAPREPGVRMLVTAGQIFGTIGGGALEHQAITAARSMLTDGTTTQTLTIALGPEIGMCCGGRVSLSLKLIDEMTLVALAQQQATTLSTQPTIWIYGAGHVGQALTRALAPLPFTTHVIDSRQNWLNRLPTGTAQTLTAIPEAEVNSANPNDAIIIMTHDHAQDFMIAEAALTKTDLAYVGMIGSTSKRKVLEAQLARTNGPDPAPLHCPIGHPGKTLRSPEIIAALLTADLTQRLL
ncbi:MAG: xanthine dehydrogenase accessory protein XdhC [Pikeienuella sp.]